MNPDDELNELERERAEIEARHEPEYADTRRFYGLVAAYAHVLPNQDVKHLTFDASLIDTARADIEEMASEADPVEVWSRATDEIAMLAGMVIQKLARERGTSVAEVLEQMGWGR